MRLHAHRSGRYGRRRLPCGLASAVANQGGVGVISSAGLGAIYNNYSKDYRTASIWGLKEELRKAREATKGIIGVNVMVAMSNFADMVKTAIAEKADIIFSGAGLPLTCRRSSRKTPRPNGSDRFVGARREGTVPEMVLGI